MKVHDRIVIDLTGGRSIWEIVEVLNDFYRISCLDPMNTGYSKGWTGAIEKDSTLILGLADEVAPDGLEII
jgi:hypothetical protein